MKSEDFNKEAIEFLDSIKERLTKKREEYASNNNVFRNFENAKGFFKEGTEKLALWNYVVKHLVSIKDYCENNQELNKEQLEEKTGDIIAYMTILNIMK